MLKDLDNFNKFCEDRKNFSYSTFGDSNTRGCESPLLHLREEISELIENPNDEMEWADCWLLLLDAACRKGYTVDDLVEFGKRKLEINKKREWVKQPSGVYKHKK